MTYTEHKITLDIHKTVSSESLRVKKGDTGRRLLIYLVEKGVPYHIDEDCYAVFSAMKPDGNVVLNDCTIKNCVITYDFTEQTVAAVGLLESEIILYGADGKQITSASFSIIVENTVYDKASEVESTSELNALAALIADVEALKKSSVVSYVTLYAAGWVGEDSPYSQVVEIEGVTEYSQVDLKPSVEQLAIFHEKDLAFVTENEDGVVTVYAIGDKPANDYTMQVTILEVIV